MANYVTLAQLRQTAQASKDYTDSKSASVQGLDIEVVTALPSENIDAKKLYAVANNNGDSDNLYDEYYYRNNTWELFGTARIDLTNYALKSELPAEETTANVTSMLSEVFSASDPQEP